jgi:pimeloyl-ACP methyl ester carboxylesterase
VVVGHSMGGMVLARFCAEHPAARARRIDHAVFLATSAWPLHPVAVGTAAHHAVVSALTAPLAAGRPYPWNDTAVSRLALRTAFGPRATGRTVDDLRRYMAEMGQRSLLESLQAIAGHSVLDELGDVDLPATVVVGTRDRLTPPRHARALAAALPHARLELLEGTGHQVMQEDPRRLSDLLREIAGA